MSNKKEYRTQYDRMRVFTNIGSRMKKTYMPQYDSNGDFELVETGEVSLYDYIQSHKDSVDIHVILKRFANGDAGALTQVQGAYGDFTNVPVSYADMLNLVIKGQQVFDALSLEEKEKFGFSYEKWLFAHDEQKDAQQRSARESKPAAGVDMDTVQEIINQGKEGETK